MTPRHRVLFLAGPTATGKTAAAIAVAERYGAVVLSADAMQVYRGLDIGTAKATPEEQARAPHRGIDVVDLDESFDAAAFVRLGDALLAEGRPVVVAGGTSLYLRALVRGLVPTPPPEPSLRAELDDLDDPHAALEAVDPVLAARLHPNDRVRVLRGLEVFRSTGTPLSALQLDHATAPDRLDAVGIWLDRDDLRERIDQRVGAMVEVGYLDEVERVLGAGFDRSLKPLQSLGYRHLCDHLIDGLPLDEALRRTTRDTWRFARKQRNWMRVLGYRRVAGDDVDTVLETALSVYGPPTA